MCFIVFEAHLTYFIYYARAFFSTDASEQPISIFEVMFQYSKHIKYDKYLWKEVKQVNPFTQPSE